MATARSLIRARISLASSILTLLSLTMFVQAGLHSATRSTPTAGHTDQERASNGAEAKRQARADLEVAQLIADVFSGRGRDGLTRRPVLSVGQPGSLEVLYLGAASRLRGCGDHLKPRVERDNVSSSGVMSVATALEQRGSTSNAPRCRAACSK